ncbi:unnamed protein product [Dicrocoelium dendriticum]|nr:unnamed protein product [Dicrocoelium dendriticum]
MRCSTALAFFVLSYILVLASAVPVADKSPLAESLAQLRKTLVQLGLKMKECADQYLERDDLGTSLNKVFTILANRFNARVQKWLEL